MLTPRLSTATSMHLERPELLKSHGYFQGHKCYLPKEKVTKYEIKCGRFKRKIVDLITVQMDDIRARAMYRSYASLCAEKYLQVNEYPCSIHPFSKLRIVFDAIFAMAIFVTNIILAIHYSKSNPKEHVPEERLLLVLDVVFILNIILEFFTGYVEGDTDTIVVLNLRKIGYKYCGTWLILDIMTVANILPLMCGFHDISLKLFLISLKIFRLIKMFSYFHNIFTVLQASMLFKTAAEIFLYLYCYITWNMYLQFCVEYMYEMTYTPTDPRKCSWMTIGNVWNATSTARFVYSLDRAIGMLRGNANLNLLQKDGCSEDFMLIAWAISQIMVFHCGLKYIITLVGTETARAKYFIMSQQVEQYLQRKKFPMRIKNKILKFYALRFHSNYFSESGMLSCVSGQLREDIMIHTGRQLVRDVDFLKQLPGSLLLQIGIKLRVIIFTAGDIIMKINTIGDCLYFIHKGTVAIYSEAGKEVCHLEDGDFFGEIALVMHHRLRTASAVAVTNCELFRLDREDFESYVACYPTVYQDIKKVAMNRFDRTKVLNEHHKIEMSMKQRRKVDKQEPNEKLN